MSVMTPEQAAEKVVGCYSMFDIVTVDNVDEWYKTGNTPYKFQEYLRKNHGITPCPTCGAYRRADVCKICESEE